jgi:CheY-like chemotaxis protein
MRLVLVDDDSQSRRVLRKLVERSTSFEIVGEASDGAEAVSLVAELQPDAVIMDMHMPVMDGAAATREIKRSAQGPCACMQRWGFPRGPRGHAPSGSFGFRP